jgi:glycerate dehydrogenase
VAGGRWSASEDFSYWDFPLHELSGMTIGIVGFGRIGKATARIAQAFGMHVLAHDPPSKAGEITTGRLVDLGSIFRESDFVSLHCPLTRETEGLVNRKRLHLMKPTAFLINTSRGALVDELALAEVLDEGRIAGAGLDVLTVEPPDPENPLLKARNCFITPHIAWATTSARRRLLEMAVENIHAYLQGRPQNVVNG